MIQAAVIDAGLERGSLLILPMALKHLQGGVKIGTIESRTAVTTSEEVLHSQGLLRFESITFY